MKEKNIKLKYTDIPQKPPINERNPNLFYYDLRDADEGLGYDIERNVIINNIGSIVTNKDILGDREFITDEEFEMLEAEYVEKIEELLEQKTDKNNELNEEFYKNICNKYINTMSKEMLLEIDNRIVHIFIEDEYINLKDNGVINTHNFRNYLDDNFEIYAYNSYQELCERLIKDEIFYDIKDLGLYDENNQWNFYINQEELEKLGYDFEEKEEKITDETIKEILENEGYNFTENPREAIYILRDGTLVDGVFEYGSRGEDHRLIECCMNGIDRYDNQFWSKVHTELGVVQLVPETQTILIMKGQNMTIEQWNIIEELKEYSLTEGIPNLEKNTTEKEQKIEEDFEDFEI